METQKDPDSFNRAVFTKLMGEDTEDMAGTLAYKKTGLTVKAEDRYYTYRTVCQQF